MQTLQAPYKPVHEVKKHYFLKTTAPQVKPSSINAQGYRDELDARGFMALVEKKSL